MINYNKTFGGNKIRPLSIMREWQFPCVTNLYIEDGGLICCPSLYHDTVGVGIPVTSISKATLSPTAAVLACSRRPITGGNELSVTEKLSK